MNEAQKNLIASLNELRDNIKKCKEQLVSINENEVELLFFQGDIKQSRVKGAWISPRMEDVVATNICQAFQHLQDARMRCGKALQGLLGGISEYEKGENETA